MGLIYLFLLIGALFFIALPFILAGMAGRMRRLEERIAELERGPAPAAVGERPPAEAKPATAPGTTETRAPTAAEPAPPPPGVVLPVPGPGTEPGPETAATTTGEQPPPEPEPGPPPSRETSLDRAWQRIRGWLLGGNTLARVGAVVLFFGVGFLLKHSIEAGWLPVELRLVGAVVAGLALTTGGWRLRSRRRGYGLVLQGTGMGIVYLAVFAAASRYALLAEAPALALMVAMVACTSALAVLQDARSLAALAIVGGFLAPVLLGEKGSHVALFSYYLVLDLGILAIAWFRGWRALNLLGFAFTFIIGAAWGITAYRPEHFASTEPFLLAFFLIFAALPVLYARRGPPRLRGFVDGTLVFGLPLVAFGLQYGLVRDLAFGPAYSALGAALFYAGLATAIGRRGDPALGLLVEAFVGLAVAFGTLAVPLALDPQWTGSAWALEGAALLWIGLRQQRLLARLSGLAVQLAAGLSLLGEAGSTAGALPVVNGLYLGTLLTAIAGLFSALVLWRHRDRLHRNERGLEDLLLLWGLAWWFGGAINELWSHLDAPDRHHGLLALAAASAGLALQLGRRLAWPPIHGAVVALLPAILVALLATWFALGAQHPLARAGLPAWLLAFALQYRVLHRLEDHWPGGPSLLRAWHVLTGWSLAVLLVREMRWWVHAVDGLSPTWEAILWPLAAAAMLAGVPRLADRLAWPVGRFPTLYGRTMLRPVAIFALAGVLLLTVTRGDPAPLPYLPLLNPLEITQLLALIAFLGWRRGDPDRPDMSGREWGVVAAIGFAVINGMVARAVHFHAGVPHDAGALWDSAVFQAAASITWSLVALVLLLAATRRGWRIAWMTGAGLLGAVIAKLFLVDLAGADTVARIVSFIAVGSLTLLMGYLAPLPPRHSRGADAHVPD